MGISEFATGLIFAGYPVGAVITGPFTAKIVEKIGGKLTVCLGLILAGVFTFMFGLSKDTFGVASPYQEYLFVTSAVLYGCGSALAETGIMIVIENICPEAFLARIVAFGETLIGIGCMLGPLLGGLLFDKAGINCAHTREGYLPDPDYMFVNETAEQIESDGCWLATFTTMSSLAIVSAVGVAIVIPGKKNKEDEDDEEENMARAASKEESLLSASLPSPDERVGEELYSEEKTYFQLAMEYKLLFPSLLFLFSTVSCTTLNPVLELKLSARDHPPFNMNSFQVGLVWLVSAVLYMVGAFAVGFIVDKMPEGSFKKYIVMQLLYVAGMITMILGWFCVGPAEMPFTPDVEYNASMVDKMDLVTAMDDKLSWVVISQIFMGLSSALYTIPSLPAMLFFIPQENEDGDENPHRSFVTGLWVTLYAASVALGNLLGSLLYESLGMRQMSGVLVMWASAVLIADFVWMYTIARHFSAAAKQKGREAPKTVAMSDLPESEKTPSLRKLSNEYQAPSLPGRNVDQMSAINEENEDYVPPVLPGATGGTFDTDTIGTEFDI